MATMEVPDMVDVIVVGGGAAGCAVAGRLAAADRTLQVALIEAGANNKDLVTSHQPAMYISHIAPTSTTASFYAAEPSEAINGRQAIVPCGAVLGGGSSINFMMYTRPSRSDFNGFGEGWQYEDVLPFFKKLENVTVSEGYNPKLHGTTGPLKVSHGGVRTRLGEQFIDQAVKFGYPFKDDVQDFETSHGVTYWAKWIAPKGDSVRPGHRQDAAHGYVHPILESQTNLHLLCESKTIRVLFSPEKDADGDRRAVGIEYCHNPLASKSVDPNNPEKVGQVKTMMARKMVVLSAGALASPCVLERSGVGLKSVLEEAGVEQVVEVAVGETYQDHQLSLGLYSVDKTELTLDDYLRGKPEVHGEVVPQWEKDGGGLVATNAIDAGLKARPSEEQVAKMSPAFQKVWQETFANFPDRPVIIGGLVSTFLGDHGLLPQDGGRYLMTGGYLMLPRSIGSIHLAPGSGTDPFVPPAFDAAFLKDDADIDPQVWMFKQMREIVRRMPSYRGEFAPLHPQYAPESAARCLSYDEAEELVKSGKQSELKDIEYSEEDDAAIVDWLRNAVQTTWHSLGTVPMKPRAEGGVLDQRLNVYGTKGLKVVDLSICPNNLCTNTYSSAVMIGEKGAHIIGHELGIVV